MKEKTNQVVLQVWDRDYHGDTLEARVRVKKSEAEQFKKIVEEEFGASWEVTEDEPVVDGRKWLHRQRKRAMAERKRRSELKDEEHHLSETIEEYLHKFHNLGPRFPKK